MTLDSPTSKPKSTTPLWAVASGHYTTGALCAVPILVLLWLVHFVHPSGHPGTGRLFLALVAAVFVTKTIDLGTFRTVSIRQRKDHPGSATVTAVALVSPLIGGAVGALLVTDRFWSIALVSAMLVVFLPTVLLLDQPWKEGATREQTRHKIDETKAMTRNMIIEHARERHGKATAHDPTRPEDGPG